MSGLNQQFAKLPFRKGSRVQISPLPQKRTKITTMNKNSRNSKIKMNWKVLTKKEVEDGRSKAYKYIMGKYEKTTMKILGYKVGKIESEDGLTMFLEDMSGGPIISGKDEKETIVKFKEALGLAIAVKKLTNFKHTGKF